MKKGRIAAIVISAGCSSRMGNFKPFLKFGEYTAVETVINSFKSAGINDIILVVGYRGCEVIERVNNTGVTCILNEDYSEGMFTSIIKGIKALDDNVEAFFVHPVDVPLIKNCTISRMKDEFLKSNKGIFYPTFIGKKGHPPIIDSKYKKLILSSSQEGGLKRILNGFVNDSICIPVFDEAILMDMDTKDDYDRLLRYFYLKAPNVKECSALLSIYNVPDKVIKHCTEVARVSMNILDSITDTGCELNRAAIEAASLLHDIAMGVKNHAVKGAFILKEIGYENVGDIILTHTDIEVDENDNITENEILYLADKLVKEDKIMPLNDRLNQCLEKYRGNLEASKKIKNRYDAADKIIRKIEKLSKRAFIYG